MLRFCFSQKNTKEVRSPPTNKFVGVRANDFMKKWYLIILLMLIIATEVVIAKDIKVIIELKEEPIVQASKKVSNMKLHKEKIEKEHKDIKIKLDKTYRVKKIKREYKHLLNGMAFNVSEEEYEKLLLDKDIKKVWIDKDLHITDTNAQMSETVAEINADKLWNKSNSSGVNVTGVGITVAILDTGILYSHNDFGNCTLDGINLTGNCSKIEYMYDFYNDDNDALDDHGHGTHVAGTVGANGTIKGVAPDTVFMIYKVCSSSGSCPSSDVISAIENATLRDADVISMSLGSIGYSDSIYSSVVDGAMNNDTVLVAAAGNEGTLFSIHQPSATLSAISVGASCLNSQIGEDRCTDSNNKLATFSSRGYVLWSNGSIAGIKPDIIAPGVRINSTCYEGTHDYCIKSGTSMATPHVAGAVALLRQLKPDLDSYDIKSLLLNKASSFGYESRLEGAGLVNLSFNENNTILVTSQDRKSSLLYFGNNFNSSIGLKNFTLIINITNKATSDVNITIEYRNSSFYWFNIAEPPILSINESTLIDINITINNSLPSFGGINDSINLTTNLSESSQSNTVIRLPWAFYSAINNDSRCPPATGLVITSNYTMASKLYCYMPDMTSDGAILFGIYTDNATLDCNGSTIDGIEGILGVNYGIQSSSSYNSGLTIRNCNINNYWYGIRIRNNGFLDLGGASKIINNTIQSTTYGISYSMNGKDNMTIRNNNVSSTWKGIFVDGPFGENVTVIVANNTLEDISDYGIDVWDHNLTIVTENIINVFNYTAIRIGTDVHQVRGIVVKDNLIQNGTGSLNIGVQLVNVRDIYLNKNTIENTRWGIYCNPGMQGSLTATINNSIINNTTTSIFFSSNPNDCNITLINTTFKDIFFLGSNGNLFVKHRLTVNVTNTTGGNISGATVTVVNDNGSIDWTDTTDINGKIIRKPTIDYWQNKSELYNHTNLVVTASAGASFNSTSDIINMDDNKEIQLVLGSVIPPPPIEVELFLRANGIMKINEGGYLYITR